MPFVFAYLLPKAWDSPAQDMKVADVMYLEQTIYVSYAEEISRVSYVIYIKSFAVFFLLNA